ncbi:MAG: hypothetical protein HY400_06320 [Elusimicrobia bacterium]|nr:hypothetical protein [Elusimicrobiota bacterium]
MDNFKIAQLTKELVTAEIKTAQDPCASAAEIVKKALKVALKNTPSIEPGTGKVITDACQGAMVALLLGEQNLAKGATAILRKIGEMATEMNLDPTETMMMALKGIADLQRFVQPEQLDDIRDQISLNFLGAGEAFHTLIQQPPSKITT